MCVPLLWRKGFKGKNVNAAIIDTGCNYTHTELITNFQGGFNVYNKQNKSFISPSNICNTFTENTFDISGNGTHSSGIIASENKKRVIGVAPEANLYVANPIRQNSRLSNILSILSSNWLLETVKPVVTNNSYCYNYYSQSMYDTIKLLSDLGICYVIPSGNDNKNNDLIEIYPNNYKLPNIINVAAMDSKGNFTKFTNYGLNNVDVIAPGSLILSTYNLYIKPNYPYAILSGTSMACAHVTGAYILLWDILFSDIKSKITHNNMVLAIQKLKYMSINNDKYTDSSIKNNSITLKSIKYGFVDVSKYLNLTKCTLEGNMFLHILNNYHNNKILKDDIKVDINTK